LFAGVAAGVCLIAGGFLTGLLPLGTPRTLHEPCRSADIARLVPGDIRPYGSGGRTRALCRATTAYTGSATYTGLEIEVTKQPAAEMQSRGCAALAGLGTVRPVRGLGDAACVVTEDGRLRISTVLVRRGKLRIFLRYGTDTKDAATVERDALDAARRVTSAP
jgi:hypothetical protein